MRCLLDKVTARHIMEGMLKLVEGRSVTFTDTELFALHFYQRAHSNNITLFILPQTYNLLKRLNHLSRYVVIIRHFLAATQVSYPARYFKRWKRRLQEYGFTKEDAEVLALATFGTTPNGDILGMHIVATSDQPMEGMPRGNPKAIVEYAAEPYSSVLSCIFTYCRTPRIY